MKKRLLEISEALERGKKLTCVLLRFRSGVSLGAVPQSVELSELLEARFFSETEEVRVFRQDGVALRAAVLTREPEDRFLTETYQVEDLRFKGELLVCHILNFDGDGQAYKATTCLSGWKEVPSHV